jgi:uncharacterized membrane protein YdjX (TVP38/TMEM64 family)
MPNPKQADQSKYSKFFKYFKYGLFAIAVIGGVVLFKLSSLGQLISQTLTAVLNWVQSLGNVGIVIFIIVYIGATMVLISGAILTLGAGLIFGVVKGSIIVSIASTAGATAAFLVGRYLMRDWVAKQIEKQPKFRAIDQAVAKDGWKIVGLTRLSPLFPFVFLNYAFGATQVSLKDYVLSSWIGMMPGTVLYVYLGYLPNLAVTGEADNSDTLKVILNLVGLLATIGVTVFVTKIAGKSLQEQVDGEKDSTPIEPN